MPTVAVSEESKRYLETLRKKVPADKIPSTQKLVGSILSFIRLKEDDFISKYKELEPM